MGIFDSLFGLFGGSDGAEAEASRPESEQSGATEGGSSSEGAETELGPEQFRQDAESAAEEWDDLELDFTVESLERLDEYAGGDDNIVATLEDELDDDNELLERMHGGYTVEFGTYFGEVLVRRFDGQWVEDDGWAVAVPLGPDEALEVAVFDIAAASFADEPRFAEVAAEVEREFEAADASGMAVRPDADRANESDGALPDEAVPVEGPVDDRRASIIDEAEELATYWSEHGLDFTPESLARLDSFVDDQWDKERFRDASIVTSGEPEHMDDAVYTGLVYQLGGYYGEVLVRNYDAEWTDSEDLGRTVVAVSDGETELMVNVFHIAEDCLTEPAKFALNHDTVVDQLDVDAPRVSSGGGTVVQASVDEDEGTEVMDDEELIESFEEDAATFADEWPRYELDFTPDSLVRVDALVREEFDALDFDDVELGDGNDGDSLFLTAHAMEAGAYFAEVLIRNCGAEWRTEDGLTLVVPGRDAEARLEPISLAAECFRGDDSFAATFEAIRAQLQLDVDPIDDDAAFDAIEDAAAPSALEDESADER